MTLVNSSNITIAILLIISGATAFYVMKRVLKERETEESSLGKYFYGITVCAITVPTTFFILTVWVNLFIISPIMFVVCAITSTAVGIFIYRVYKVAEIIHAREKTSAQMNT